MSWTEDWLWPKVDIRRKAQNAIDEGFWAAAFWAGFKGVLALIALLSPAEGFGLTIGISAAVYASLAFGIRRRSRIVAVFALIIFIAERLLLGAAMALPNLTLLAFGSLLFANGVRGTFAYHKFPPLPANIPSVEQSFRAMSKTAASGESQDDSSKT
ncbi:MAG: hypothetical protein JSS69_02280 [Acidobacteria bacterium]|nr:hypothetical protein [Acidobacteriota bacterium]MBS1864721.1 hypothetical protein [Acidobacteriota bacterium]